MMAVMTVVFASLFKRDMHTYALFIFSGMLPWQFMQTSIIGSTQAIIGSETFIKKIFIPKAFFPLATVSTELLNFTLSLSSLFILALVMGLPLKATLLLLPAVIGLTFVFLCGAGLIMSIATVYFRDLAHISTVVLSAIFYLMPVIYPIKMLPPVLQTLCNCNPFYRFIKLYRATIYDGQFPTLNDWTIASLIAVGTLFLSLYLLKRQEKDLIFRL